MGELILDLELVTPLFLGGADARGDPVLRAAPIRGVLRYWLRAWLGAHGILEEDVLHRGESRIFGDTKAGSAVILRVFSANGQPPTIDKKRPMLPHNPNKLSPAPAFKEGQSIRLTMLPRPGQVELPPDALTALFLWLHLGGLGKRQRRGFGSFRLAKLTTNNLTLPENLPQSLRSPALPSDGQALAQSIKETLKWAMVAPISLGVRPPFPALARDQSRILVCRHAFQSGNPPYQIAMREFWLKALRSSAYADPEAYGFARGRERRASPVHLHVARSQKGYHLVLTVLTSEPSPKGEAGWQKVTELMEFCCKQWDGEYVW